MRSSHLPACLDEPPFLAEPDTCLFDVAPDRGYRVSPCGVIALQQCHTEVAVSVHLRAHAAVSSLWPYSSVTCATGRLLAAILPYGVRTFLEDKTPAIAQPTLPEMHFNRLIPAKGVKVLLSQKNKKPFTQYFRSTLWQHKLLSH